MSLKLSYNDEQVALQESIDGFCTRAGTGPQFTEHDPLPKGFWDGLAELGVLGLGTAAGGGGALEIAAAMETLGRHGAPGPLVGTFVAGALLDEATMAPISAGTSLVSVGEAGLFPWAGRASVFIEISGDQACLVVPKSTVEERPTTGGEPWGTFDASCQSPLGDASAAGARAEIAIAAYAVGAATELLDLAVDYARDRIQFNKSIATFQAVSHPLATSLVKLNASRILCRGAAQRLDTGDQAAAAAASTARLSATASATATAYQAHQLFGAMGFTLEGPVAHLSLRVRQVGLLPPSKNSAHARVLSTLNLSPTR